MQNIEHKHIVIFGGSGQIGSALCHLLPHAIAPSHQEVDLLDSQELNHYLLASKADIIINAAAYTKVDQAEQERKEALALNHLAVEVIAKYCGKQSIPFLHYSTDYVYDGKGKEPFTETHITKPLNIYGQSKLFGDQSIMKYCPFYLIFRVSWVYDAIHANFFTTMLRLGKERESLEIVSDQIGAPAYAPAIAKTSIQALNQSIGQDPFPSGVYHLTGQGETNWYDFAKMIFAKAKDKGMKLAIKEVSPILSENYTTPAIRPLNSRLDCTKLSTVLHSSMPHWMESLDEAIALIGE